MQANHIPDWLWAHYSTSGTKAVKAGSGVIHAVVVNTTAAGTIAINDGTGNVATLKASIAEGTYYFDALCNGKIEVVLGAASDVTVLYR